ncbi:hypothetical protein C8F04DRAFT_1235070 [Mycena alexandri]|uniref:Uncharacterized protein n=1 Tax=Mycena alexandri TaxID=1745969 RepID=A0AAD6STP5_9AGAR|nr:hypothetical protein C8F04DRAFT_1235070 [Mycena alexandri]
MTPVDSILVHVELIGALHEMPERPVGRGSQKIRSPSSLRKAEEKCELIKGTMGPESNNFQVGRIQRIPCNKIGAHHVPPRLPPQSDSPGRGKKPWHAVPQWQCCCLHNVHKPSIGLPLNLHIVLLGFNVNIYVVPHFIITLINSEFGNLGDGFNLGFTILFWLEVLQDVPALFFESKSALRMVELTAGHTSRFNVSTVRVLNTRVNLLFKFKLRTEIGGASFHSRPGITDELVGFCFGGDRC